MRAQANVYHVKCFTCAVCNCLLHTGDHFGIYDNKIFCRTDFAQLQYNMEMSVTSSSSQFNSNSVSPSLSPESMNMISSICSTGVTCPPTNCLNGLTSTSSVSPSSIPNTNYDDLTFGDYPPRLSHTEFTSHESQQMVNKSHRQRKRRQADSRGSEQAWQLGKTRCSTLEQHVCLSVCLSVGHVGMSVSEKLAAERYN